MDVITDVSCIGYILQDLEGSNRQPRKEKRGGKNSRRSTEAPAFFAGSGINHDEASREWMRLGLSESVDENLETFGTRTQEDGGKFTGYLKGGIRHGHGTLVEASGEYSHGLWINDKIKRISWSGKLSESMQVCFACPSAYFGRVAGLQHISAFVSQSLLRIFPAEFSGLMSPRRRAQGT